MDIIDMKSANRNGRGS